MRIALFCLVLVVLFPFLLLVQIALWIDRLFGGRPIDLG